MTTASPDTRKRDLRSAVTSFAKLKGQPPAAIPLDLADIRRTLDGMVPAQAKVSRKRWANLRSDLAAAIEASGLRPMLKTADVELDEAWSGFLRQPTSGSATAFRALPDGRACAGFAPEAVDDDTIDRFIAELDAATLIRNLGNQRRTVALAWNALVRLHEARDCGLSRCRPAGLR